MSTSSTELPIITLARHGETEWSRNGKHTGRTDIPLTARGEEGARLLGKRLNELKYSYVWTSPRARAHRTAELAGFPQAEVVHDLTEWDYGEIEGITTAEYRKSHPDWVLFRDGCPGGESLQAVSLRADRIIARLRLLEGNVLLFSHGHFSRILAARWIGLDADKASCFYLTTAAISQLGYEHSLDRPAIRLWNDAGHLAALTG
ncbi:MAG: histidine phosphatase family protein [Gemmataceae bacterium]